MLKNSIPNREADLLASLSRLASERASAEERVASEYLRTSTRLDTGHQTDQARLLQTRDQKVRTAEAERDRAVNTIRVGYEAEKTRLKNEFDAGVRANESGYRNGIEKSRKAHDETRWQALAIYEAAREGAKKEHDLDRRNLVDESQAVKLIEDEANYLFENHRRLLPVESSSLAGIEESSEAGDPRQAFHDQGVRMDELTRRFRSMPILKWIRLDNFSMLQFLIALIVAYPAIHYLGTTNAAIVLGLLIIIEAIALMIQLRRVARRKVAEVVVSLRLTIAEVHRLEVASKGWIEEQNRLRILAYEAKKDNDLATATEKLRVRQEEFERRRDLEKHRLEQVYPPLLVEAKQVATKALADAEARSVRDLTSARGEFAAATEASERTYQAAKTEAESRRATDWNRLANAWFAGMQGAKAELASIRSNSAALFPEWRNWTPTSAPDKTPPGLRFGEFHVEVDRIADYVPENPKLAAETLGNFDLPAMLTWDEGGSLVVRANDEGRDKAVKVLQSAMVRILTAFPPSKARFTIIDPVGLGQNFASFMHLGDHDELLINHRIWTDSLQIDQRLGDLTDHMENVIQTYLRNDYETIEQYNAQAGEVAEPSRFLIIANFPQAFTETAMRRLVSIAKSGARCGVHVLMSIDMSQAIPFGFNLKEVEANASVLQWRDGRFHWREPRFEHYPLTVDSPPPADSMSGLLDQLGKTAKAARRVEVPFEVVAPKADAWWTGDTRSGLEVPLGRAGATKLQNLSLGKGTSQHVLIAGKTGSGKSTFLHALITNVALRYSPDEIELYLIDFKKGVEFKTYANHQLPHARVVAVESEREFGLSVLQRLDSELKTRGDLYRKVGAQDVATYRANTGLPLPRILLLVDEFQEFFVEDDKLAQECSLLLDRLVRQGRAFGIHVHLGSQTLSGAYSLARSTLGQMAVRIALQCSESDAHLILSEENTAARLLTRPGEAIYNDANGLVEGNHIFQIVWLGEQLREKYLIRLREMAQERTLTPRPPMIVFEGNSPAELERSPALELLTATAEWAKPKRSVAAWLGDAIAIKEPTSAVFQPQSGSHLLLIGQQEESALGIMSGILVGLAAQIEPGAARFILFDGTPLDAPTADVLTQVAAVLPHEVERGNTRNLPRIINELAEEVERRRLDETGDPTPIYLLIHDLNRFRDLRKKDDDYGFGSYGGDTPAPPNPAKQFGTILREGPAFNVHVIVWCDAVNNLNRAFDRGTLNEFEMRILFQMSAGDSSNLIDSPAAGKLGTNRAYFHSEEQGKLEKFRPYGLPSPQALADFKAKFAAKPVPERSTKVSPPTNPAMETETDSSTNLQPIVNEFGEPATDV